MDDIINTVDFIINCSGLFHWSSVLPKQTKLDIFTWLQGLTEKENQYVMNLIYEAKIEEY